MPRLRGDLQLETQLILSGLPEPVRELRFHPTRQFRFDWAWPDHQPPVALEYEGGTWSNGGHVRGGHYTSDCIKYAEAALLGWVVIRATWDMVNDGTAIELIRRALESNNA